MKRAAFHQQGQSNESRIDKHPHRCNRVTQPNRLHAEAQKGRRPVPSPCATLGRLHMHTDTSVTNISVVNLDRERQETGVRGGRGGGGILLSGSCGAENSARNSANAKRNQILFHSLPAVDLITSLLLPPSFLSPHGARFFPLVAKHSCSSSRAQYQMYLFFLSTKPTG